MSEVVVKDLHEFLQTTAAKQNLELSTDRDIWKAEAERMTSGYDAAQSELAALREELVLTNERWSKCLEGAEKKCERQIRRNARLVGQRNTMQLKRDEARQRLVVAARLLTAIYDDTPIVWPDIADFLAMNKPTESGASE